MTQGCAGSVFGHIVGSADFSSSSYAGYVELDTNADGFADGFGSSNAGGAFSITQPLTFGQHSLQVRAVGYDDYAMPVIGDWTSFSVTLTPPSNDPPSVSGLDWTMTSPSLDYAAGTLTGLVSDDRPNNVFEIEIDVDNNGSIDETAVTGSNDPNFSKGLTLIYGSTTLQVRAKEHDSITGQTIYGAWESLDVDVNPPTNGAPDLSNLSYTVTAINFGSGKGTLAGTITDDSVHPSSYQLQFDLNDDGQADGVPSGDFPFDSSGTTISVPGFEVPLGPRTIRARAVAQDQFTGVQLASAWASVNVNVSNTPPQFQGGTTIPATPLGATKQYTFTKPENLVGHIGTITALETDPGDSVTYEILPGTGAGIAIDASTGALSANQPFNYETFMLAGVDPEIHLTVRASDTNGGQDFAEVVVRVGDITNEPSITLGTPNSYLHYATGTVNGPASWGSSGIWIPSVVVQQFYGDSSGAEIWNQGGTGSGQFSTSGATGNSVFSSNTVGTSSGNACNSVINGACYNGISGEAGQLEVSLKGFTPGTYTIVFEVTSTITINTPNTVPNVAPPYITPTAGGIVSIKGVTQGETLNGLTFRSATSGASKTFTNWCATTITVTNPLDLFKVLRWTPTISFTRGMVGDVTVSGNIRIAEITGP